MEPREMQCMSRPYLCKAHVCTHTLATAVYIPHLDLAIQPSRQQQMTSLGEEPAADLDQVSTTTAESVALTFTDQHGGMLCMFCLIQQHNA